MIKRLSILLISIFSVFLFSCTRKDLSVIDLNDSIFWSLEENDAVVFSGNAEFSKLTDMKNFNLERIAGRQGRYLWLMIEFNIPEPLKEKSLGLVIPYLHFSEQLWLNGRYVGSFGKFPDDERSMNYAAHYYHFPAPLLKQYENNRILIKVWCHGKATISGRCFITESSDAAGIADKITFKNSRGYMFFEGGLFCAAMLFFMIYIFRRKEKSKLYFALMNFSTMFFLTYFFAPEVPWYNTYLISHLSFVKISLCISACFILYFSTAFMLSFVNAPEIVELKFVRIGLMAFPVLIIIFTPSYNLLMALCIPVMLTLISQLAIGIIFTVKAFFDSERRKLAFLLTAGYTPIFLSIFADLILRIGLRNNQNPFFMIHGWQVTIVIFVIILCVDYNKVYIKNELLNSQLEKEVEVKTRELIETNTELESQSEALVKTNNELESQMRRNFEDLEMARIVQQHFFPHPKEHIPEWNISVHYNPVSQVSGDLYDFYMKDQALTGFSLFDVSGHGISAGLITMLAKNIVRYVVELAKAENVSENLERINTLIIKEKGKIENYLTGLLFRMKYDKENECQIAVANAGHPYPILYSAKNKYAVQIKPLSYQKHYGMIGISGMAVAFPQVEFRMEENDILVCYTDGITEAENSAGEQFGRDRIMKIISENADKPASEISAAIFEGLDLFLKREVLDDDTTLIVLKKENSSKADEFLEEL